MVNVLCVCAVGVGSSLMLKMNAEKVLQSKGFEVHAENTNVTGAGGMSCDILVTTPDVYGNIRNCTAKHVILMENMVSKRELDEKISAIVSEL